MHRELDPQEYLTWDRVVADASPHDHIVQLYQDHDFLNSAVCRFIGASYCSQRSPTGAPSAGGWRLRA